MKILFAVVLFVSQSLLLNAASVSDSLYMLNNYEKKEIYISMRDGVKLFTSIYIPKNTRGKNPILLTRTPYSSEPYGTSYRKFWKGHFDEYIKKNYIMVVQDVRGRWMSDGTFENIRPLTKYKKNPKATDESTDANDTIDWLVKNLKNNNGNVGVYGGSYGGFYTLMAAIGGHKALKAISPQAPVTDWFIGDDFHRNGAFFAMDAFAFFMGYDKPRPKPTNTMDFSVPYFSKDNYKFYLETGSLKNLYKLTGDSIEFWKQLFKHPNYSNWWKERTVTNFLGNIKPATLVVGSPYDAENAYGAWHTYKSIKSQSPGNNVKLAMGPWYHMEWVRGNGSGIGNVRFSENTSQWYANNIEYPFFHHHLKGQGSYDQKEAVVYFSGENQWKSFDVWPPSNILSTSFYLNEKGRLDHQKPSVENTFSSYVSNPERPVPYTEDVHFIRTLTYMTDDQRFAARRPDVLVFQTDVLTEDLTIAGPVIANLWVNINTTDADFVVKVIDVFPDDFSYEPEEVLTNRRIPSKKYPMGGYQMLVRGELMRGKYRNSFEHPAPFVINKPENVKFTAPDIAHTFKKGHRLMVQVQSSWFPLADRNPQKFMNIYESDESDFQPALIKILHNATHSSSIELPILKKSK